MVGGCAGVGMVMTTALCAITSELSVAPGVDDVIIMSFVMSEPSVAVEAHWLPSCSNQVWLWRPMMTTALSSIMSEPSVAVEADDDNSAVFHHVRTKCSCRD